MFNVLLVVFAGIWLLVGGTGIMNIMLATVKERTREIGIRRAVDATRQHIIQQFLTETVVLTASGGLSRVLFGLSIAFSHCRRLFFCLGRIFRKIWAESCPRLEQSAGSCLMDARIGLGNGAAAPIGWRPCRPVKTSRQREPSHGMGKPVISP